MSANGQAVVPPPAHPLIGKFTQQLRAFQQRLLQIDARNPSVFTGKIIRRKNFDLTSVGTKIAEKAFAQVIAGGGRQRLIDEAGLDPEVVKQREHLRLVDKAAADREEETGLEDLRVATVWLEGRLDDRLFVRAPLILHSAELTRAKGNRPGWTLELPKDSELQFNQALLAALRKNLRWSPSEELLAQIVASIETLQQDKRKTPHDLLQTVGELLRQAELPVIGIDEGVVALNAVTKAEALAGALDGSPTPPPGSLGGSASPSLGVRIRGYVLVGVFPQSSTALYQDYDELAAKAEAGEVDQGIIDNLLETPGDAGPSPADTRVRSLDDIPATQVNVALPCDPSQFAVLREAQVAECTVVRGPPGTGKSQVIANLIVDALSRGERVLVVCQKRAALDVVQARLQSTHLTPWTYVVHDAVADQREVYAQLRNALSLSKQQPGPSVAPSLQSVSAQIDRCIADIRAIVEPLRADTHGRPLTEWYRRAPTGQSRPAALPEPLVALSWDDVQRILEQLEHFRTDALRLSSDGSPVRARKSWHAFGGLHQGELLKALDTIIGAAAGQRGAAVVVPRQAIDHLRQALATYRELVGRWWRFLSPRWWRARKDVQHGCGVLGTSDVEAWDPKLDVATQLRQGLDTLREFFDPAWIQQLEQGLSTTPDTTSVLEQVRSVVQADFERVVTLDQRLGRLEPWAAQLVCHHDPELLSTVGFSAQSTDPAHWRQAVQRNAILRWIDAAETQYPALRGEPFVEYRRHRDRLVALLAEQAQLTIQAVAREVHAASTVRELPPELAQTRTRPETLWNKLEHELGKQRRLYPLRKTLREFAWPLRTLARCWLMSPEVAAEVLPLQRGCFDMAIFDEASQLPLERALPVLYRCKRVVIAGDEQQMPPSRFFESSGDDDELDDEGDPIDDARVADSLLEQAKKIYNFRYLSWHYRSEHGQLIDFSNQAFYDGSLHITPPPTRTGNAAPIQFHPVDGTWDKQVNLTEAQYCVQLIARLAREHRNAPKSIGVVAVNQKQQNAIDEALHQAEQSDPALAELLHALRHPASGVRDDALVVKNIENVQGDERDIIIFSTAFARPPNDRTMRRNFGAISQVGGENRLNVAFTRARTQMHILCSFDPNEMPVEGLKNRGPRVLKSYLQYAKAISEGHTDLAEDLLSDLAQATNRPASLRPQEGPRFDSAFEQQVHQALSARGLHVDTQVGVGGYRIDLAVVHPDDPTRYCLAIECDGATYHSGRSVRERDIARQQLLESRGWTFERIWSRDWWKRPQAEVERIIARVHELTSRAQRREQSTSTRQPELA